MSLLITRGLGEEIEYVSVAISAPEVTTEEWGRISMKIEPSFTVVSENDEQD